MRIGIDIDDTIADTFETGFEYAQEFTKKYCGREYSNISERMGSIKTHKHWQEIFEWSEEEEIRFFEIYYDKIIKKVKIKEDVCDIINKLYKDNEIIFITARHDRNENTNIETVTKKWLEENNIPFNKVFLGRKKVEVCEEEKIDIFIDDSYENCKSVKEKNIKVYLIDHITNKNIQDDKIERAYGWKDLYEKIEKYREEKDEYNKTYCS